MVQMVGVVAESISAVSLISIYVPEEYMVCLAGEREGGL